MDLEAGLRTLFAADVPNAVCARNREDVRWTSSPSTCDGDGLEVRRTKMSERRRFEWRRWRVALIATAASIVVFAVWWTQRSDRARPKLAEQPARWNSSRCESHWVRAPQLTSMNCESARRGVPSSIRPTEDTRRARPALRSRHRSRRNHEPFFRQARNRDGASITPSAIQNLWPQPSLVARLEDPNSKHGSEDVPLKRRRPAARSESGRRFVDQSASS